MSRALLYLWFSLGRRGLLQFVRSLRRPTTLIGFAAVLALLGFIFYFRQHEIFARLVRPEVLIGGALVMVCGSLFKGFLQRGLVFEPPDLEFLFTSPFTQRQLVFYRLLPCYLFAVIQSLVVLALFASHLKHPILTVLCLTLLQACCFHLSTAASIFAGTLSEPVHHRIRWMLLGTYFFWAALYLRVAWDFKIIPSWASSSLAQLLFYPAATFSDIGSAPAVHLWALRLLGKTAWGDHELWSSALYLAAFVLSALVSLGLLLRLKGNLFEVSLAVTTRVAQERMRRRHGHRVGTGEPIRSASSRLPSAALFRGVGAIVWKNLVVASRSHREMYVVLAFTLIYTGFLTALLWIFHDLSRKAGGAPADEARGFTSGIAIFVATLALFLQRMFPFDFRRDGVHILAFRTLPMSPLLLALAEIAVPTALCLAAQAFGIVPLIIFGHFDWPTLLFILLGYPAIALALNAVWNLHYLLSATRRTTGDASSASAVGTLMVVALSFLVFFPAGWATVKIANYFIENSRLAFTLPAICGLTVQYTVDILLILGLAKLFNRFEVSRDFQ